MFSNIYIYIYLNTIYLKFSMFWSIYYELDQIYIEDETVKCVYSWFFVSKRLKKNIFDVFDEFQKEKMTDRYDGCVPGMPITLFYV